MTDMAVNQRIKLVRESLGMSQREFSRLLALSGGYIAGIEVNLRPVNHRLIKLIAAEFGVNENWLLTGTGQMFTVKNTDERATKLVALFKDLPAKYQDVVFGMIELLRKAPD
jgi:transcriptional regulator with XRE-family HTH domain